jgi:CBS domain-containing protein
MERRIIEGTVSDLAPRPGINVSMDATLEFAVSEMRANKIGCVLVVDGGELRGVLSEREILMKDGGGAAFDSIPVGGLMRENSICLRETDSLADAFHQMAISGHRHLPVRRQDGLYAVVSARDLMQYLCQ